MRITFLIVLSLYITPITHAAQIPLFSAFNLNRQFYNPAYTAYKGKYELSYLGGHARKGISGYETFYLQNRSTNQIIEGSEVFDHPNYSSIAIGIPIRLKKDNGIGFGFSYTNNDMQRIETFNIMGFSFAYNWHERIGRFSVGFTGKRVVASATDKRIYYTYLPETQAFFKTYTQKQGNWDFGLMYSNDSGTLDIGLSVCNNAQGQGGFGAKSIDEKYLFTFQSAPTVVATTNFQMKLTKNLTSKNSFIGITNSGLNSANFLARTSVCYKRVGLGIQYSHKRYSAIGPAITFSNSKFDILYSYIRDINNNIVAAGLHEMGVKIRI
jgi:hypothetical protein